MMIVCHNSNWMMRTSTRWSSSVLRPIAVIVHIFLFVILLCNPSHACSILGRVAIESDDYIVMHKFRFLAPNCTLKFVNDPIFSHLSHNMHLTCPDLTLEPFMASGLCVYFSSSRPWSVYIFRPHVTRLLTWWCPSACWCWTNCVGFPSLDLVMDLNMHQSFRKIKVLSLR